MYSKAEVIHTFECDICKQTIEQSRFTFTGSRIELPVLDGSLCSGMTNLLGFLVCQKCLEERYYEDYRKLYRTLHKDAWGYDPK